MDLNKLRWNQMGQEQRVREQEAAMRFNSAMQGLGSPTRGNALASARAALRNEDTINGVSGWKIKDDLAANAAQQQVRARLNSLKGDELNEELKRLEAMMPRRI